MLTPRFAQKRKLNKESSPQSKSVADAFFERARVFLIEDYLPKIELCLEQLDDQRIWWRANPQSNSIGNLILHLCGNSRQWIISGLGAQPDNRKRDAEFEQAGGISRAELLALLRNTLSEVGTVLSSLDPATILETRKIQGTDVDVLQAVFHVTEHFSMHTGQIILLTKLLAQKDLKFYEFLDDVPVGGWQSPGL